ncbi:hypothetical protein HZ326_25962 [Fusarium oxysporum f. sp. albedinis]|nr:hypothetical protein HZ326_25962 [Fusarium oxysporum f. sp. albedinis]
MLSTSLRFQLNRPFVSPCLSIGLSEIVTAFGLRGLKAPKQLLKSCFRPSYKHVRDDQVGSTPVLPGRMVIITTLTDDSRKKKRTHRPLLQGPTSLPVEDKERGVPSNQDKHGMSLKENQQGNSHGDPLHFLS